MGKDIIFCNAIARYNDMKLLRKEQFLRLTSAADYAEAVKMLYEHGYVKSAAGDPDSIALAQVNALNRYVLEDCPVAELTKIILNPFVYNNAKLYYKRFEGQDEALYALEDEDVRAAIESKDYSGLSPAMRDCLTRLDLKLADGTADGRTVDNEFTAAMFKEALSLARRSFRLELVKLVRAQIDLNNFLTFLRCRKLGRPWDFCAEMLCEGGKTDIEDLAACYDLSMDEVKERLCHSEYYDIYELMADDKINLDLGVDAAIMRLVGARENDYTALSPFMSYYYKQVTEFKAVRMILILIKNNLKPVIDKRLRGLYE